MPDPADPPLFAPPAEPPPPDRAAGWVFAVGGAVLLALLAYRGYAPQAGARPTTREVAGLDPNTADAVELEQVPGLGPARARAVVEHRAAYGPLPADGIQAVKGVGPLTADRAGAYLTIPPTPVPDTLERKPAAPLKPVPAGKITPGEPPIDVNAASLAELQRLPGIGPALAARIMAARPFSAVDDLRRVKGVGPKTMENLRPHVTVTTR